MSKPTDLNQQHLDVAGCVMRELRALPNALDAQITLALAIAYLCLNYDIHPANFARVMEHNVTEVLRDPVLLSRATERIHGISTERGLLELPSSIVN